MTPGLPLGSHSCNPFALVASPKLGLRQLLSKIEHHELVQACCDDIFPSHVFTCINSLMLCYVIETFSSNFLMINENMLDNIRLFQNLLNSIVLHKYKMMIIYELLMSRELNN